MSVRYSRRKALTLAGAAAGGARVSRNLLTPTRGYAQSSPTELVHWSWYSASDNADWGKLIASFNDAHKSQGVQIRQEFVPLDTYGTKLLAAAATGNAPDFGTAENGLTAQWAKQGVTVPIEEPLKQAGLDLSDFDQRYLDVCTYYGSLQHAADGRLEHGGAAQCAVRARRRARRQQASARPAPNSGMGAEDDRPSGEHRLAVGMDDDGFRRPAAGHLERGRVSDGLSPGQRGLEEGRRESGGRRTGGAVGARHV